MNTHQTLKSIASHKADKSQEVSEHQKPQWTLNKRVQLPSSNEADREQEILPDGDPSPVILWGTDR